MIRRLTALMWLRAQILLTNKSLLIQVLVPYLLLAIYRFVLNLEGNAVLFMCLSMGMSLAVGGTVASMIAEEKEKNNLSTLLLSGVGKSEYLLSVVAYPMLLTVINIVALPYLSKATLGEHVLPYAVVGLLTSMAVMFLNVIIGFLADTQTKAQIYSMPIMLCLALVTTLSQANDTMNTLVSYSFFGAFSDLSQTLSVDWFGRSMVSLVLWVLFLIVAALLTLKGVEQREQSLMNWLKNSFSRKEKANDNPVTDCAH